MRYFAIPVNVWDGRLGSGNYTPNERRLYLNLWAHKTSARFSPFQGIHEWACMFVKIYMKKLKWNDKGSSLSHEYRSPHLQLFLEEKHDSVFFMDGLDLLLELCVNFKIIFSCKSVNIKIYHRTFKSNQERREGRTSGRQDPHEFPNYA
jgi:hypothetical protein